MNAARKNRPIEAMAAGRRAGAIQCAREHPPRRCLSPDQLNVLAEELAGNPSPERARLLTDEMVSGFYPTEPGV